MDKLEKLKEYIAKYRSAVIAFSGGVDSAFLAKVAGEVLGESILLVTASSSTYPQRELDEAKGLASQFNLQHRVITSEELDIDGFSDNPPDRCYYCKKELFSKIAKIASDEKYDVVFDGSNLDDLDDFRPGRRALKELGIHSPLLESGLTKGEIRKLSEQMDLPTSTKPSFACLASRFPYGEKITRDKLDRVGIAENDLFKAGFKQFRVRSHDTLARIEIAADEMERAWAQRDLLLAICKKAGFTYVSLDLAGYRTGAMNEVLVSGEKQSY